MFFPCANNYYVIRNNLIRNLYILLLPCFDHHEMVIPFLNVKFGRLM